MVIATIVLWRYGRNQAVERCDDPARRRGGSCAPARCARRRRWATGATRLADWTATSERLRSEHRRIYDAVRSGNPDDAEREAVPHITGYYRDSGHN